MPRPSTLALALALALAPAPFAAAESAPTHCMTNWWLLDEGVPADLSAVPPEPTLVLPLVWTEYGGVNAPTAEALHVTVTVEDGEGVEVAGTVSVFPAGLSAVFPPGRVHWRPDAALAPGTYALAVSVGPPPGVSGSLQCPFAPFDAAMTFTVMEDIASDLVPRITGTVTTSDDDTWRPVGVNCDTADAIACPSRANRCYAMVVKGSRRTQLEARVEDVGSTHPSQLAYRITPMANSPWLPFRLDTSLSLTTSEPTGPGTPAPQATCFVVEIQDVVFAETVAEETLCSDPAAHVFDEAPQPQSSNAVTLFCGDPPGEDTSSTDADASSTTTTTGTTDATDDSDVAESLDGARRDDDGCRGGGSTPGLLALVMLGWLTLALRRRRA